MKPQKKIKTNNNPQIMDDNVSLQDSHIEDDLFEGENNNFFDGIVGKIQKQQQFEPNQLQNSSTAIRENLIKLTEQNLSNSTTLEQKIKKKRERIVRKEIAQQIFEDENQEQQDLMTTQEISDKQILNNQTDDVLNERSGIRNDSIFAMDTEFWQLGLGKALVRGLMDMQYQNPTKVQKLSIPAIVAGNDVLVSSMTGSGKTAAFLLPALQRFGGTTKTSSYTKVLVVTPTRELALQCYEMLEQLNKYTKCTATLIIGAVPISKQEVELRKQPDIVIATPGRLVDLLKNSYSIDLQNIEMLIFDEADRLLEMGFEKEVKEIVSQTPLDRQTVLFSATLNAGINRLTDLALKKPIRISVDYDQSCATGLKQFLVRIRSNLQEDREAYLLAMITKQFTEKTIIFVKTKKECHRIAMILGLLGMSACELHGNLAMQQRISAFEDFKVGKFKYLLATDLAARGLDIQEVKAVINFEIPFEVTRYIHRVGRTARIGSEGVSVTLCLEKEVRDFKKMMRSGKQNIENFKVSLKRVQMYKDKIASLEKEISNIVMEEHYEREIRKAEMETRKLDNILNHEQEINHRPKKKWIESFKDKLIRQNAQPPAQKKISRRGRKN